jgi:hypothetical protein
MTYATDNIRKSVICRPLLDFKGKGDPFANGGEIGTGIFPGSEAERYVVVRPHICPDPLAVHMATDALPAGLTATQLLQDGAYTTHSDDQTYLASLLDNIVRTAEVDAVLRPKDTPIDEGKKSSGSVQPPRLTIVIL